MNFIESISKAKNLPEAFFAASNVLQEEAAYSQAIYGGPSDNLRLPRQWQTTAFSEVRERVLKLAVYLKAIGVKPGDKVAIMSFTRPEWMIADLAILSVGAVSVSIYQSLNRVEAGYILYDSGADVVFAENKEQVDKLLSLLSSSCLIPEVEDRKSKEVNLEIKSIISFEEVETHPLVKSFKDIFESVDLPESLPEEVQTITRDSVASYVYTSGTTGPPKGVVQTHGNHLANIVQAAKTNLFAPDGSIFLYLPLAHSFAKLIGYIGFVTPTLLKFPSIVDTQTSALNPASMLKDLRESNAHVVPTVPRMLEKMLSGIQEKASRKNIKAHLLQLTLAVANKVYKQRRKGQIIFPHLAILSALTNSVRKKIKTELFGKEFKHIVSGGAKLPVDVNHFFQALGVDIYEGYGLTETCVATNVNRIEKNKIGSVGPGLEGIETKICEDGEIAFRGPNITKGYHNRPKATAASWDNDGWFYTGDLGRLDEENYLYITGRKKELIVTAGGKKIAPQAIEEKLQFSPFISHAVIYGEGRPHCVALVTIEQTAVTKALENKGVTFDGPLWESEEVVQLIGEEIRKVNNSFSRFEQIRAFRIVPIEFSVENSFLTPSFKLKRDLVVKTYFSLIEDAYSKAPKTSE